MSRPLYNSYSSKNQSCTQGQYELSSIRMERDPRRASRLGPGSCSQHICLLPSEMSQSVSYRPEQSRAILQDDIDKSIDMHIIRAGEEVRLLGKPLHQHIDQGTGLASTQRDELRSSGTRIASYPMSSTSASRGHRHLGIESGSSSLDCSVNFKRPAYNDSTFYSSSVSSNYASGGDGSMLLMDTYNSSSHNREQLPKNTTEVKSSALGSSRDQANSVTSSVAPTSNDPNKQLLTSQTILSSSSLPTKDTDRVLKSEASKPWADRRSTLKTQPSCTLVRGVHHMTRSISNRQPTAKVDVSKALPTPAMMHDYAVASPKYFPHTCSLCNKECTHMKEWLSHQSSLFHLESCELLRKQYPNWISPGPRTAGKDAKPLASTSAKTSRHRVQKTRNCYYGSEGRREKRSSRSPYGSRYNYRSQSRSNSPWYECPTSSCHRPCSSSPERKLSPRSRDEKQSSPRMNDKRWSTQCKSHERCYPPRRSCEKTSPPRRSRERPSPPRRSYKRNLAPRRSHEKRSPPKRKLETHLPPKRSRERPSSSESSLQRKKSSSADRLAKKLLETSAPKLPENALPDSKDGVAGATIPPIKKVPQGSNGPFWVTLRTWPFLSPTMSPWFIIPDYLTVRGKDDIEKASGSMLPTIMLTGLPEGNYQHEDVAKLVWRYFSKQNLHSLYYNVTVLTLQRRAFVFFADWTTCCDFARDHITNPVSVKGSKLSVHFVLQHMNPESTEEMMYTSLMNWGNAGVPEPKSLEERLLCVEISETSVAVVMIVMDVVASIAPFVSFLPLANRICIEMADSSGVTQVVEKYNNFSPDSAKRRTAWSKVKRFETLKTLKQRLKDSSELTINFKLDLFSVKAKSPAMKCQTQPHHSFEPSESVSQAALQTGGPDGSTISEPIAAGPSATAASDAALKKGGEKPRTESTMDSTVSPEANEDVKWEKGSLTTSVSSADVTSTSAVSGGTSVPAASSPAPSATVLRPEKNFAELPYVDIDLFKAITEAVRQRRLTSGSRSQSDKGAGQDDFTNGTVPTDANHFDAQNFNMDGIVTAGDVCEDVKYKSPETLSSSSSKQSSRARQKGEKQSSGGKENADKHKNDKKEEETKYHIVDYLENSQFQEELMATEVSDRRREENKTTTKEEASAENEDTPTCGTTDVEASGIFLKEIVDDLEEVIDDPSAAESSGTKNESTPKTDITKEDKSTTKSLSDTATRQEENKHKSPEKNNNTAAVSTLGKLDEVSEEEEDYSDNTSEEEEVRKRQASTKEREVRRRRTKGRRRENEDKVEVNAQELVTLDELGTDDARKQRAPQRQEWDWEISEGELQELITLDEFKEDDEEEEEEKEERKAKQNMLETCPLSQEDESMDSFCLPLEIMTLSLHEAGSDEEEKADEEQAEKTSRSAKCKHDDDTAVSKQRREIVEPEAKRSCSRSSCVSADYKPPAFKPNNPLGKDFVVPTSGYFCNLCPDFYESSAKDLHCSSQRHYNNLQKPSQKLQQKPSRNSTQSSQGSVSE